MTQKSYQDRRRPSTPGWTPAGPAGKADKAVGGRTDGRVEEKPCWEKGKVTWRNLSFSSFWSRKALQSRSNRIEITFLARGDQRCDKISDDSFTDLCRYSHFKIASNPKVGASRPLSTRWASFKRLFCHNEVLKFVFPLKRPRENFEWHHLV